MEGRDGLDHPMCVIHPLATHPIRKPVNVDAAGSQCFCKAIPFGADWMTAIAFDRLLGKVTAIVGTIGVFKSALNAGQEIIILVVGVAAGELGTGQAGDRIAHPSAIIEALVPLATGKGTSAAVATRTLVL